MFAHLSPKERFGYVGLLALLLFGAGYVGAQYLRKPAPIIFESNPSLVLGQGEHEGADQNIVVHVAGEVANPGITEIKAGSRVKDAIEAAGGASTNADLELINLAAKVIDGTQIFVPTKGESDHKHGSGLVEPQYQAASRHGESNSHTEVNLRVIDLNSATQTELETLPGIGPVTAKKIIEYRSKNGRFKSVEELLAVQGIGVDKLEKMRQFVKV